MKISNPSDLIQNASLPSLELRRRRRATLLGINGCRWGIPLGLLAVATNLHWNFSMNAWADLTFVFGCILSLMLTRKSKPSEIFRWAPFFFSLWMAANASIYTSGGIESPFLITFLTLLLIVGLIVQNQVRIDYVFTFIAANFLGWMVISLVHPQFNEHRNLPILLVAGKQCMLIISLMLCVRTLIFTEKSLAHDSEIQEKKLSETQNSLVHAARMAEIGDLVAATAHELAQPIQVVASSGSIIKRMFERESLNLTPYLPIFERMHSASQRIIRLLSQLRDFSREEPLHIRELNFSQSLREIIQLVGPDLKAKNVQLELNCDDHSPPVAGDGFGIQQVVLNLINNARDAAIGSSQPKIKVSTESLPHGVRLKIQNNGPGIPLEIQKKMFKPYFTTKEKGKGTGLGLAICEQIIEKHAGRILFSSAQDDTTFVVELPFYQSTRGLAFDLRKVAEGVHTQVNPPAI